MTGPKRGHKRGFEVNTSGYKESVEKQSHRVENQRIKKVSRAAEYSTESEKSRALTKT